MKQRIIFFGSGWFVIPVIEKLVPQGLSLVVTNESNGKVAKFCKEHNIPYRYSDLKDRETIEKIMDLKPSVAVLASFGAFVPDEVINLFPNGIINIHPSLLPRWKGPSPVQYSILNGDSITGVSLIKLDDQIDHGPILSQKQYNLTGNETLEDILSILFEIGADLVVEQIEKLENGEKLTETPQDHSKETWSYKINKKDGYIDLDKLQANSFKLSAMINALYPWPGVWFRYDSKYFSHSEQREESKLQNKIVKLLPEGKIQVEGKKPMSYKDFINGFGEDGKNLLEKIQLI